MPLAITDLAFAYHPRRAPVLSGLSATIPAGAITAVLGPNGSGKSTLLRLALGALAPTAGSITLAGTPAHALSARRRAHEMVFIAQKPALAAPMTVRAMVRLGRFAIDDRSTAAEAAVDAALAEVELASRAADLFAELSAGQQQRAALARALAQVNPHTRLILADEPFAALDPRHTLATMAALDRRAATGVAVLIVLHDVAAALRWASHALLLTAEGRPAAFGPAREVLTAANLEAVFAVPLRPLPDAARPLAFVPMDPP